MTNSSLEGIGVLITRPRQQGEEMARAIEARGGRAVVFPSLEITPRDAAEVDRDVAELAPADISIFISRNAVEHGIAYGSGRLAAIGPTTAAEIEARGEQVDIVPTAGFDSEHLLALSEFIDVAGKTIRIIRGSDGRELLADTLRERGARVEYLSTYEQQPPAYSAEELLDLRDHWQQGGIGAVVVMSVQSLRNLGALLDAESREWLRQTPLVTPAARVLKEALESEPERPAMLAAGPRVEQILDAIAALMSQSPARPDGAHERN